MNYYLAAKPRLLPPEYLADRVEVMRTLPSHKHPDAARYIRIRKDVDRDGLRPYAEAIIKAAYARDTSPKFIAVDHPHYEGRWLGEERRFQVSELVTPLAKAFPDAIIAPYFAKPQHVTGSPLNIREAYNWQADATASVVYGDGGPVGGEVVWTNAVGQRMASDRPRMTRESLAARLTMAKEAGVENVVIWANNRVRNTTTAWQDTYDAIAWAEGMDMAVPNMVYLQPVVTTKRTKGQTGTTQPTGGDDTTTTGGGGGIISVGATRKGGG